MFESFFAVKDLSTNYFKEEEFMLKICGISLTGNEHVAYKIYSFIILYVFVFPYPFVASGDLFKHELAVFAEIFVYYLAICMAVSLIAVTLCNRLKLGKLLKKVEQEPFLPNAERGGDEETTLINGWILFKKKQSLIFCMAVGFLYTYSIISAFIIRLRSNDYHDWTFSFGTITPLNVSYSPNYEIVWMYQNIAFFYISVNASAIVLILAAILAYISVQFQILQDNLRRMVLSSYKDMLKDTNISASTSSTMTEIDASKIPWKYLKMSLKKAVLYHVDILSIAEDLEGIFNNTILSIYLCTLGMVCFEVYRISTLPVSDVRTLVRLIETAAASFDSLMICYGGQKMTNESLNVAKTAYEANYVGVDIRFQKGLMMIIQRSQKPLLIKAGKFIETSMVTYVWIVRSAYSTCMVLRNVHDQ